VPASRRPRRYVIFAPSYPPAFLGGGPARTLSALVRSAPRSNDISVFTPNRDSDGTDLSVEADVWVPEYSARVMYVSANSVRLFLRGLKELRNTSPDVIYINSFFNWKFSILPQFLSKFHFFGTPKILLAPRGEFDPGALAIRARKKSFYLFAYRILRLHIGVTWHASAEMEAGAIRRLWGRKARVLIRENETSLPTLAREPSTHEGPVRIAFLGRLAPKKGLLVALEALAGTRLPAIFDIYGPEEDTNYVKACREVASQLPQNVMVRFHGAIRPEIVPETLQEYDCMLVPTAGENFGHVIAESLSASCPVICSSMTPWTDRLKAGGGIVVGTLDPNDWRLAIESIARASPEDRLALRLKAGSAFNVWHASSEAPHVFTMLDESVSVSIS
jgi:glycosyltransferase involved in cell wall biosynthesis